MHFFCVRVCDEILGNYGPKSRDGRLSLDHLIKIMIRGLRFLVGKRRLKIIKEQQKGECMAKRIPQFVS
jgi:hypothetical protein